MRRIVSKGLAALAFISALAFAMGFASVHAADVSEAPDALVAAATAKVTQTLQQDRGAARAPEKLAALIDSVVLPLFDFRRMTRLAMARNWRVASPEQRTELVEEFRVLLVRTYSNALSAYEDQTIVFRPLRMAAGDTDVTVRSTVGAPGSQRLSLDYSMEKTAAGWKVYDITFAGVSLVTTYQSTFSAAVREDGVDGLIRLLKVRNRRQAVERTPAAAAQPLFLLHAMVPTILRGR